MFIDLDQFESIRRPTIRPKPWMAQKRLIRVTAEMLPEVIDECIRSKRYALDLETTGLDSRVYDGHTIDRIAGACLSPDGVSGYYIPVLHPNHMEHCVPFSLFASEMRRLIASGAVAIFHNAKFDQEFLQFCGGDPIGEWDDPKKWEDTLILAYLRNNRERNKGLKHLSKVELSMEMIELEELFAGEDTEDLNFGTLDPTWEPAIWYAASDAICTFLLHDHLRDAALKPTPEGLPSQESLYFIEKLCVAATRWMERNRIPIDRDKVVELIRVGQREWLPALSEVYTEASKALGRDVTPGYFRLLAGADARFTFDPEDVDIGIMSSVERARAEASRQNMDPTDVDAKGKHRVRTIPKSVPHLIDRKLLETVEFPTTYDVLVPDQLGLLLRELGVQGLNVTEKSGQVKTSKDELDRVLEEAGDEFPYIKKVKRFREVAKAIASNLRPLYEATDPRRSPDRRIRINFEGFKTDTGRFSTPQERDGRGWTGRTNWNLQSIPSGRGDIPECMKRLREVVRAEEGKLLVAVDFSGQELRVVTNFSREPLWEAEFFRCAKCGHLFDRGATVPPPPDAPPPFCPECGSDSIGDLHTLTAIALYGADVKDSPEFKEKRNASKGVNFSLCYGGGGMAVVRSAGVSKDEGWRIKRQFDTTYKGLSGWWARQHEFARKTKHVLTAFNRRCPLPDIDSADGGFRSKAERNAVNAPIQGCLHPDGRVPTDRGLLRVEDLYKRAAEGGPTRFNVWTGKGWAEAQPILSGPKRLHETTLEDGGTLLTSPEHLFRVWDSKQRNFVWVRQHDLVEGDWVARDPSALDLPTPTYTFSDKGRSHNAHGFSFDGNHPVLWELLGRLIGDGSLREDGLIVHVGEAPAVLAREATACGYTARGHAQDFAFRVSEALGLDVKVVEKQRDEADTRKNTWQVQVWNSAFVRFCVDVLGLKIASCLQKEFPTAVWKESVAHRAAFLRGYMDADGGITPNLDLVGLRSANPKLLREAYLLFRSVGVRASCRLRSQFVSVLDRHAFRKVIGFSVPYKAARLAKMKANPQTDRNTRLPPDVVQMIGHDLRGCPGYTALPRARKSAVLRLTVGSGSKAQCLQLTSECGVPWLGEHLESALAYDYSRVVSKRDTGETVTMYDVEVFDEDHAFACDGVIVHNTGADLMKYSMGLLYRECKKRGWLRKLKPIITMHDEIVFEIDEDIFSEAIDVAVDVMLKKTISRLAWRVPLTCDIEAGRNWTVPWNITKIRYGKKELPKELEKLLPGLAAQPTAEKALAPSPETSARPPVETNAHSSTETPPQPIIPTLPKGADFVHVVRSSELSLQSLIHVAKVIHRCRGKGDHRLRVVTETGESLWDGEDVFVNASEAAVWFNHVEG